MSCPLTKDLCDKNCMWRMQGGCAMTVIAGALLDLTDIPIKVRIKD